MSSSLTNWLERTFSLQERDTNVATEVRAGLATFLTMCYILLVNPQLLSKLGISPTAVVVSTALSSATASFLAGYFGNLPLGLAPGVGLSAYLTYGLVMGNGLSVQEAFTTCFVSGVILLVFSLTGVSQVIMKLIPRSVKLATIVGMGLQIALVGMTSVHLVVPNAQTIVGLGDLSDPHIWMSLAGLILIGSLLFHEVPGGILIGILVITVATWSLEHSYPAAYVQLPDLWATMSDSSAYVSLAGFDPVKCAQGIAAFLFIGIIDVSGVIFGMASLADLIDDHGAVPGATASFVAVSVGSIVSALTGGTPVIVYVESATGIKEGGRSGLTAVVVGALFLVSLFLAPVLGSIPVTATSPVAILIGAMMMSQAKEIDWNNMSEAIPGFLTLIIMPFTFSITNGIVFGLIAAFAFHVTTGQAYRDLMALCRGKAEGEGEGAVRQSELTALNGTYSTSSAEEQPSSYLDNTPFVRAPSLILRSAQADAVHRPHGLHNVSSAHAAAGGAGGGHQGHGHQAQLVGGGGHSNSKQSYC